MRRVVITGLGLVTPLGNTVEDNWAALSAGKSGISQIPQSWDMPNGFPVKTVGLVTGEQPFLDAVLDKKNQTRTDRFIHLALIAAAEALKNAGISAHFPADRSRIGTLVGVGIGGLTSFQDTVRTFDHLGPARVSPFSIPKLISNMAPGWICMQHNLQGANIAVTSACASSTDAVGMAFDMIRLGRADVMLAGGAEACAVPLTIAAFANMRALSTWSGEAQKASRPFDAQRSGFVLAEGGAMLVLESFEHAQARGAHIVAEVCGYGATADAYHMTAMHPDALGAEKALRHALTDAQLEPSAIDYINAHGTATPMNDPIESALIKKVFGQHATNRTARRHLRVSSTKSMTGHMLGATGAAELAYTALALHHQLVPPTINIESLDPLCDLDYVSHARAQSADLNYALSQSFGFGGSNSVVILRRLKN